MPCRDTIALMVTALLGIGSFAVQGKLSKDAEAAQRESELAQDEREKARLAAAILLDRARLQVRRALHAVIGFVRACLVHVTVRVADERLPHTSQLELDEPHASGDPLGE